MKRYIFSLEQVSFNVNERTSASTIRTFAMEMTTVVMEVTKRTTRMGHATPTRIVWIVFVATVIDASIVQRCVMALRIALMAVTKVPSSVIWKRVRLIRLRVKAQTNAYRRVGCAIVMWTVRMDRMSLPIALCVRSLRVTIKFACRPSSCAMGSTIVGEYNGNSNYYVCCFTYEMVVNVWKNLHIIKKIKTILI